MKGQRIRYQQAGDFHFLTFSSYRRRPYLSTIAAMELFEDPLERVRSRYLFVVAGYVVMPEHVHLLVNEPGRALLSRAVQALKLSVSMRSRERPFWQAHYYDRNVHGHEEYVEKLRYIRRNPVKRGLAEKPEDWKWSSFRHYQTGLRGTVEIESEWTARMRGFQLPKWMCYGQLGSPSPVPKSEGSFAPLEDKLGGTLNLIRFPVRPGPPADDFVQELEKKTGRGLAPRKGGRPALIEDERQGKFMFPT